MGNKEQFGKSFVEGNIERFRSKPIVYFSSLAVVLFGYLEKSDQVLLNILGILILIPFTIYYIFDKSLKYRKISITADLIIIIIFTLRLLWRFK